MTSQGSRQVKELAGKIALVTGGAVRVGRAIALGLARQGADVAIGYHRSVAAARATADAVSGMLVTTPPLSPLQTTLEPPRTLIAPVAPSGAPIRHVTRPLPMSRPATRSCFILRLIARLPGLPRPETGRWA